jgi:hypothetical protein
MMTFKTMAELEAESPEGFINPKRTPQEWKELEERNKAVRKQEAQSTAIETEEDLADPEEYPEDEE